VTSKKLLAHLQVDRYGDFRLTDAIRPALSLPVVPRQGFRQETYRNPQAGLHVPVLAASVSRERLFEVFLELLDPLGAVVDVVLESSHDPSPSAQHEFWRHHIDLPVLQSYLCDFEELLLNDGCTGLAIVSEEAPIELQFDEHKLLIIYASDLKPFARILQAAGIARDDRMKLITEGEHMHSTDPRHLELFEQLCCRLGVSDAAEHVSW
jgi:hypothetical protein